jgi:hypothetical protein
MTEQLRVATVAPVKPDAERSLGELLEKIGLNAVGKHTLPLARLSTTQCVRLVLLDTSGDPHGRPIEPQHTYMSGTDARVERHLVEPSLAFPDGMNQVFERCERDEFEQLTEPGR